MRLGRLALSGDPSYRAFLEWTTSLASPPVADPEEGDPVLAIARGEEFLAASSIVPDEEIRRAEIPSEEFLELRAAIEQIRSFHEKELAALTKGLTRTSNGWSWRTSLSGLQSASYVGRRWLPYKRVGVVLEGALRELPTLLNFALAARVAGVEECVVAYDPNGDESARISLMVAAREVGARTLFRVGGCKAAAMMAKGSDERGPCSVISCPAAFARSLQKLFPCSSFVDSSQANLTCILASGEFDRKAAAHAWIGALAEGDAKGGVVLVLSDRSDVDVVLSHAESGISGGDWGEPGALRATAAERGWLAVLPGETHAIDLIQSLEPSKVVVFATDPERTALSLTTASQVQIGPHVLAPMALGRVVPRPTVADFLRVQTVAKFTGR